MRIPPPNPLTTVCVWIAATFIAVREAADKSESTKSLAKAMSGAWSYLPISVIALAAAVFLYRVLTGSDRAPALPPSPAPAPAPVPAPEKLKPSRKKAVTTARVVGAPPHRDGLSSSRTYVPESFVLRFLELKSRQHTEVQSNAMLRPQVRQWMRVTGHLAEVAHSSSTTLYVLLTPSSKGGGTFGVRFPRSSEALLAAHNPGDQITIDCQIMDTEHGVKLENGELL